jgi:hypothetical protein
MTIEEIFAELGEPEDAFNSAMGKTATENSYFIYEIHNMSFNFWENAVWVLNDLQEFSDIAYAFELFDFIGREENEDYDFEDETDQSELYHHLLELKNKKWTIELCEEFVENFDNHGIELIQFGKISELIAISDSDFNKCKEIYLTKDELEKVNLNEGDYKIIHQYIKQKNKKPKDSISDFLDYINEF